MNHDEQNQLWRAVIADESLEEFRARSLTEGLANMKTRRRRRNALRVAVTSVAMGIVVAAALRIEQRDAPSQPSPSHEAMADTRRSRSQLRYIDDDELLAHFADRGAALVGTPGAQRLVLADRTVD